MEHAIPDALDHLVYGVPDLEEGVSHLEQLLGVRAARGGKHTGRGTHNAVLGLGDGRYLEVIAPDPDQPVEQLERPRPFSVHEGIRPGFVGWAIASDEIDALAERAIGAGLDPGEVQDRQRLAVDGTVLKWRLTAQMVTPENFLFPFVIDWLDTPHPSHTAPRGVTLVGVEAHHPDPASARRRLSALNVSLCVREAETQSLSATFQTAYGLVQL